MRLELTRAKAHYPLKVACIPISPPTRTVCAQNRTRTCTTLRLLVPETSASTNSAIWARLYFCQKKRNRLFRHSSGKRDSNPRPQPWQGCALPTELFPHYFKVSLPRLGFIYIPLGQGCALPTELFLQMRVQR